ncbi:unnamed protein product [Moneuplotes crassus]|uniref:Uncharacterized protein n=1 Tax=Euplotes crassus TaxID=5936 RepID=A0AAD1Y2B8_EUPCR|nr:unnamed protein product [Moneuplotes crassus]
MSQNSVKTSISIQHQREAEALRKKLERNRRDQIENRLKEITKRNSLIKLKSEQLRSLNKEKKLHSIRKNFKRKLTQNMKDYEQIKRNQKVKKLQELLETHICDIHQLQAMVEERKEEERIRKMKAEEEIREKAKKKSMLLAHQQPLRSTGTSTDLIFNQRSKHFRRFTVDNHNFPEYGEDVRQMTIEKQKEELNYFYGSRTFQLMKNLSENQIKKYYGAGNIAYDGSYEFKWLREYKRFIKSHLKDDQSTSQSSKDFDVTQNYEQQKEAEWIIRQKYKLMRALKKKWEQSQQAEMLKNDQPTKQLIKKPNLYKRMESTTISFEKIPLLDKKGKSKKEVNVEALHTIYSIKSDGNIQEKGQSRSVSTNTGPDIVHMLDNLKSQVFPDSKIKRTQKSMDLPKSKKNPDLALKNSNIDDKLDMKARRKRNIERRSHLTIKDTILKNTSSHSIYKNQASNT